MVEAQLSRDPQLKRDLDLLALSLLPLAADKGHYEPRAGLAERACAFVVSQSATVVPAPASLSVPRHWKLTDLVVAAGIFIAATLLFFPALNQSRFAARLTGCQNNLRQIGMALTEYSTRHGGFFPNVPAEGCLAAAGIYAPRLVEHGFISEPQILICPASVLAELAADYRVPTFDELESAQGPQLTQLQRLMGGSYGYTLGYVSEGRYQSTRNLRRPRFALMADAPSGAPPFHTLNHGACGQNVLFEDGHVQYLTTCKAHGCNDNIFLNDQGERAPGVHMHDAVISASDAQLGLPPEAMGQ